MIPRQSVGVRPIMIGMAVIVLAPVALVAISIFAPQWLGAPRRATEDRAAAALVSFANSEELFKKRDLDDNGENDYWVGDVSGFYRIEARGQKIDLVNFMILYADARPLPAGKEPGGSDLSRALTDKPSAYYGYFFAVVPSYETEGKTVPYHNGKNRNPGRFGFCAYPEREGPTFIISERREVWEKNTSGKPIDVYPENPGNQGWRRVR